MSICSVDYPPVSGSHRRCDDDRVPRMNIVRGTRRIIIDVTTDYHKLDISDVGLLSARCYWDAISFVGVAKHVLERQNI